MPAEHREANIETKVNYPLVGAFALVLGSVLVAGLLWLASGGAVRTTHDLYLAIVDESVAGLNTDAPGKYNGVDVGKVRQIRLDPGNPQQVNLPVSYTHLDVYKRQVQSIFLVIVADALFSVAFSALDL